MADKPDFDHQEAEQALQDFFEERIGTVRMLDSVAVGVVAFERLDTYDSRRIDFDTLARAVSEKLGLTVVNIANCDWQVEGSHDEEATFVAFDVPGLDKGYAEQWRTYLSEAYLESIEADAAPDASPAP